MNKKIYEIIHNDELNILEDKTNDTYQSKEMIESDFDLTLYTCTKGGLNRVTVRLNRV